MVTSTVTSGIGRDSSARLLSLVFFVSGAAALDFEIVWLHQSGLVFGSVSMTSRGRAATALVGVSTGGVCMADPARASVPLSLSLTPA